MGVPHGGWCPKGRRAEDGPLPSAYQLEETPSEDYAQRTEWNVRDADGTLIITGDDTVEGGTKVTLSVAQRLHKPVLHARTTDAVPVAMIAAWCEENDIRSLNIAGPRESESPGIYDATRALIQNVLEDESVSVRPQ
jgi:hypothetical protein